jgi:multiple sugar transport system ATP-binding protein
MAEVILRGVEKSFGRVHVIRSVDLVIAEREFCVFVGPSGCGKSTLLRLIAGLEDLSSGAIVIGGRDVTRLPPAARGIAMVFQSYALYPHMTVADNITFGLRNAGAMKEDRAERLKRAAGILQLDALLDRKPAQLSGGQRQRVAIGRAIVRDPQVFLFDEPLSNLDAALRTQMRVEISRLHKDLGATMIYVTHDQVEAMTMADKIVVLNKGRVEQVGAPLDLYDAPANLFVAGFIGSPRMNFLNARSENQPGIVRLRDGTLLHLAGAESALPVGADVVLGVRPEELSLGGQGANSLSGSVAAIEHLGAETMLHVECAGVPLQIRIPRRVAAAVGEPVTLGIPPHACHLFSPEGPALLDRSGLA